MAAFNKVTGVLAMRTTDGDDTIALGFSDAKAVILWATLNTSENASASDAIFAQGISDGTTHYAVCEAVQDNLATSNANRYHANKAMVLTDNVGAKIVDCTAAFSGSNLVLTWDWVAASGPAYLIHYLVLGGTALTNAKVINSFTAKLSTGNQARAGFGFAPDFLYFLSTQDDGAAPHTNTGTSFTMGSAANKGSRNKLTTSFGTEDNVAAAAHASTNLLDTTHAWWARYAKSGIGVSNGSFLINSWDADGYTENWDLAAGNAYYYGVLALKGLQYDIQSDPTPTATGNDALTGFGFQPEAMLHYVISDNGGVDASLGCGACTSTSDEHAAWSGDKQGANPTAADMRSTATYHLLGLVSGTPTLDVQASLVSFDADGFTQNFATAPPSARQQGWIAFATAGAAATVFPELLVQPAVKRQAFRRQPPQSTDLVVDTPFVPPAFDPPRRRPRRAPAFTFELPPELVFLELPSFRARPRPVTRDTGQVQLADPVFPVESISADAPAKPQVQRRKNPDTIATPPVDVPIDVLQSTPTTRPAGRRQAPPEGTQAIPPVDFPLELLQPTPPARAQARPRIPVEPIPAPLRRLRRAFTVIRLNVFRRVRRRL